MKREAVEKIHPYLRIADMAFDINLLVALQRAGFRILEVPTEWTDQAGSKCVLVRSSLTMFLSVGARPVDLLAVLQIAAAVASVGRLDLQKTPRAAAVAGVPKETKMEDGR